MATRGPSPTVTLEGVVPILRVRSLADSLDHYVRVLGFSVDWQASGTIASLSRDRCSLMLSEGDQGHPGGWVWIGVSDVEPLCDELRGRGATIRHPPTDYPWAYEMQIEDLDGNVLRFGSEPRPDRPTGAWRDMRGDLWIRSSEGAWTRADRG